VAAVASPQSLSPRGSNSWSENENDGVGTRCDVGDQQVETELISTQKKKKKESESAEGYPTWYDRQEWSEREREKE